jgi:hypothetical protein
MRGSLLAATAIVVAALSVATASAAPLLGATYTHTAVAADCNLDRPRSAIVLTYDEPGVRRLVRGQLAAMRAAGLQTIRILLWNMGNIGDHTWGVIPSVNGRLSEPYRTNLIRFSRDIRAAGFERFTVHFSPQWTNNPIGEYGPNGLTADRWDPGKLEENWGFIRDARTLVKQHGPFDTRFDIASEFPPSPYQPAYIVERLKSYMAELWRRYVAAFGKSDVTISVIGKGYDQAGSERFRNLFDALTSSGQSLPDWFELHPSWDAPSLFRQLVAFDRTLDELGLTQPLVVGESSYESPAAAADIARFRAGSRRPVLEVYQWWQASESGSCFPAPYRADAYRAALLGAPPAPPTPSPVPLPPIPTLLATAGPGKTISLRTPAGARVTSLDAGRYRIAVLDRSSTESFRLTGPNMIDLDSGVRFRGRKVWTVDLGLTESYGSRFGYRSGGSRSLRGTFVVR